jgi:beta-glucanase (GH16 family)
MGLGGLITMTATAMILGFAVREGPAFAPAGASLSGVDGTRIASETDPSHRDRKLVFADEFNGMRVNRANWRPYNSPGHNGNGLRRPSAFSLNGRGQLVLTARMADGKLVSGGMALQRSKAYGFYEFRVRIEPDPTGTMSGVILTWPQSGNWPSDGEIDIYETGHRANTRKPFRTFVHFGAANNQYHYTHRVDGAKWHRVAMEWSSSAIKIYRDGALVWTLTDTSAIPKVSHRLCIQLDAMVDRPLTRAVRMYVDYVRIWQRYPGGSGRAA